MASNRSNGSTDRFAELKDAVFGVSMFAAAVFTMVCSVMTFTDNGFSSILWFVGALFGGRFVFAAIQYEVACVRKEQENLLVAQELAVQADQAWSRAQTATAAAAMARYKATQR